MRRSCGPSAGDMQIVEDCPLSPCCPAQQDRKQADWHLATPECGAATVPDQCQQGSQEMEDDPCTGQLVCEQTPRPCTAAVSTKHKACPSRRWLPCMCLQTSSRLLAAATSRPEGAGEDCRRHMHGFHLFVKPGPESCMLCLASWGQHALHSAQAYSHIPAASRSLEGLPIC